MSTLVEQVQAVLASTSAAGKAWFATNTQQPPVYPYITFFRVITDFNFSFDGPSDTQATRFQVDVFSLRVAEAIALAQAVRQAMLNAPFVVAAITEQDLPPDPEVKAFRVSLDFSCWSKD